MVAKQIIAALIIVFFGVINFAYSVECNEEFYLYNFKFSSKNLEYLGRSLERGCIPGNVQEDFYRFNLIKENNVVYSYWFNPEIRYTDVIFNNEIIGGVQAVQETRLSIPSPVVDYDKISVINENGQELIVLEKESIEEREKQAQQFSFIDWVNNLMRAVLKQLFG
ncbi:hypothetical protein HYX18_04570 [Candidatus Woesearchaeota archaeon]|nr:hypothetical protein [Candidatus Woesearchaeota archaeon]